MMKSYERLKLELPQDHKLYKEYLNFDYEHVEVKDKLYEKNRTFKQYFLPKDYFSGLEIGEIINDFNLIPKIFLIEGHHVYNWHRDAWRNIAFNLTINYDADYIVMFAPNFPIDQNHRAIMYEKIEEMKYEQRKFVLFNTQIPHISINKGTTHRYLLTIAKYSGKGTNALMNKQLDFSEYENIIEYLRKKNLLES